MEHTVFHIMTLFWWLCISDKKESKIDLFTMMKLWIETLLYDKKFRNCDRRFLHVCRSFTNRHKPTWILLIFQYQQLIYICRSISPEGRKNFSLRQRKKPFIMFALSSLFSTFFPFNNSNPLTTLLESCTKSNVKSWYYVHHN